MSTVYTQKIFSIEVIPNDGNLENVVIRVQWEYRARNGANAAWTVHTTELDSIADIENFVPFSELTEELVLGWITAKENMVALNQALDTNLQAEIEKQSQAKIPPWEDIRDTVLTRDYVLVHNGQVILGPFRWNTGLINQTLQNNNIAVTLSNIIAIIPENEPLVIDKNTFIYRIGKIQQSESDPDFEQYTSDIVWNFSTGVANGTYKIQHMPLEQASEFVLSVARSKYLSDKLIELSVNSTQYILTEFDIQELQLHHSILNNDDTIDWIDFELNKVTLTKQQISDLLSLYSVALLERHTQFFITKSEIQLATTTEELKILFNDMVN